ncbi:MAG: hypothetical protein WC523_05470 [Patescibacteria group bacterium]|jgi:hypothetical protein
MSEQLNPTPKAPLTPPELLTEILATNQEILKDVKFLKNYFHWQVIWGSIKWTIFIIIIILGFISLKAVAAYLQGYADVFKSYADATSATTDQINDLKNVINIKGR